MDFDGSPLWISLKTAFAATFLTFFTGIAVAHWMFRYQGKGKGWLDGIFTLPLVLPPTVVGFLLLLLLGRNSPIGQLLLQLGIAIIFSWPATVIAATVVAFPLMYKTVFGAFQQVDANLLQAARTLGAAEGRIFWQILLPLAWPGVVAGTILAFARALGEFGATLMLAGSIPGRTQTIPIAIFFAAEAGQMGQAFNWVIIMVAIALAVIAALNYWSSSQRPSPAGGRTSSLIKGLFDWLLLGHGGIVPSGNTSLGPPSVPFNQVNGRSFPGRKALFINLQKHLPGFTLEENFTVGRDPLGLLGASGSGKSMTLRCIAGLESPNQGRIILNGRVLFDSKQGISIPSCQRRIWLLSFKTTPSFPT